MKIGVIAAATFLACPALGATFTFEPVVTCPGCSVQPASINNAGAIGGSSTDTTGLTQGFRTVGGTTTIFGLPGALFTELGQVNLLGIGAGDYVDAMGVDRPFILNANGTLITPPQAAAGATVTYLFGVNDLGLYTGSFTTDPGQADGFTGFLFDGNAYTLFTLPFANVASVYAFAINNAGSVVGSYKTNAAGFEHGFVRQSNGTVQDVLVPGSQQTEVFGINNAGSIVGRYQDAAGTEHGFVRIGGIYTTLDYLGPNTYAFGINDLNQVVGWSFPDDRSSQSGFLAAPVPEPGTFLLLGLGLAAAVRRKRTTVQLP